MLYTNNESFLFELSRLFDAGKSSGKSVWITMKRYDGRKTRNPRKPNDKPKKNTKSLGVTSQVSGDIGPKEYTCLIRARLGNRKISYIVNQKDINKFQESYSNLIKGNICGLRKAKTPAAKI